MNIIGQMTDDNGNNVFPYAYSMGGMKMDLLWTNPSPSSAFSAQTVSLDLSKYDLFIIRTTPHKTVSEYFDCLVIKNVATRIYGYRTNLTTREVLITDTGATFGTGKLASTYNSSITDSADNSIPIEIYGIKMSYIVPTEVHGLQYVSGGNNSIQLMNNDGTQNLYPICITGIDTAHTLHTISANNGTWTATEDCVAFVYGYINQAIEVSFYVDNVRLYRWYADSTNANCNGLIPIAKGQVCKLVNNSSPATATFYKLIK